MKKIIIISLVSVAVIFIGYKLRSTLLYFGKVALKATIGKLDKIESKYKEKLDELDKD